MSKDVANQLFDRSVKPVDVAPRTKGLGLGADRSVTLQSMNVTAAGGTSHSEELVLKKGACCVIVKGDMDGRYGTVSEVDECNARVTVTMALGGDSVTVSQSRIRLVTKKDYEKSSKYLNQAKVERYREEEEKTTRDDRREDDNDRKAKHRHRDKEEHRHRDKKEHRDRRSSSRSGGEEHRNKETSRNKRKGGREDNERENYDDDRSGRGSSSKGNETSRKHTSGSESKRSRHEENGHDDHKRSDKSRVTQLVEDSSSSSAATFSWLFANLRVRVIDKTYMGGKYFKEKVTIEDVISEDCCMCRTSDGKVLEGVRQSQLETVIPRDTPAYVRIVGGQHRSQLGEILSRDKSRCTALVQLLKDRDVVATVDYEHICEYTGDIDAQFDY